MPIPLSDQSFTGFSPVYSPFFHLSTLHWLQWSGRVASLARGAHYLFCCGGRTSARFIGAHVFSIRQCVPVRLCAIAFNLSLATFLPFLTFTFPPLFLLSLAALSPSYLTLAHCTCCHQSRSEGFHQHLSLLAVPYSGHSLTPPRPSLSQLALPLLTFRRFSDFEMFARQYCFTVRFPFRSFVLLIGTVLSRPPFPNEHSPRAVIDRGKQSLSSSEAVDFSNETSPVMMTSEASSDTK